MVTFSSTYPILNLGAETFRLYAEISICRKYFWFRNPKSPKSRNPNVTDHVIFIITKWSIDKISFLGIRVTWCNPFLRFYWGTELPFLEICVISRDKVEIGQSYYQFGISTMIWDFGNDLGFWIWDLGFSVKCRNYISAYVKSQINFGIYRFRHPSIVIVYIYCNIVI